MMQTTEAPKYRIYCAVCLLPVDDLQAHLAAVHGIDPKTAA